MGKKNRAPLHIKSDNMTPEIVWKRFLTYSSSNVLCHTPFKKDKNHLLERLKSVRFPNIYNEGMD